MQKGSRAFVRRRTDDHHVAGQRRQLAQLTIQNRTAVDDERALVAPAEAGRLAAGQNGCAHFAILT
jgi:hypothetical protein